MGGLGWLNEWSIGGLGLLATARFIWSQLRPPDERRPFWLLRLWDWLFTIADREIENQQLRSQLRRRDALIDSLLADRERASGIASSNASPVAAVTTRRLSRRTRSSSPRSGATSGPARSAADSRMSYANSTPGDPDV